MKKTDIRNRSLSFASDSENETFGKFILQTNEVQVTLAIVILLQSSLRDKKYREFLFEATFGKLIFLFQACAEKTIEMRGLLSSLKNYNNYRKKIAHKMYLSESRLSQKDAEEAIMNGESILETLDMLINSKHKLMSKLIKK